jgi:hypothetical protein
MSTIEKELVVTPSPRYASKQEVDTFISTYKKERWAHNTEHLGKEDALSGWYSVEQLQQFIEEVKMRGGDGVRFHFGVYPDNYSEAPGYIGRQTIVLMGTRSKDGTVQSSKQLYIADGETTRPVAMIGVPPCPEVCPWGFPDPFGLAIVDHPEKGITIM